MITGKKRKPQRRKENEKKQAWVKGKREKQGN